jgi:hypothetical protein
MTVLGAIASSACQPSAEDYVSERIIIALAPEAGERAILRYDPNSLPDLPEALRSALEVRGVDVDLMRYGAVPDFDERLDAAAIYVWLPDPTGDGTTPTQQVALAQWLDGGRGRQIHFHWSAGTMGADGVPEEHSSFYDERYLEALGIDYQELDRHQDAAIAVLQAGPVRVTTPDGTDITFEVGARPFNKQNGDASQRRMESARIRIDREVELPAGVVRVAPIETSVNGTVVVPRGRFADGEVSDLIMRFEGGVMTSVSATGGEAIARAAFEDSPALRHFRELGIGFNPALKPLPNDTWIPYFGYGEGVVRLSLGNNQELGGNVGGEGVRWFFFSNATVRVGGTILVEQGELVMVPHLSGLGLLGLLGRQGAGR